MQIILIYNETMSINYCFTFSAIELTVRYCDNQSKDLGIISSYVHIGLQRAKNLKQLKSVRSAHMRVIDTLIDTMCDNALPLAWRQHCHLYIKRLLPLLFEMLEPAKYNQKVNEINILHTYFLQQPTQEQSTFCNSKAVIKKKMNQ
ncbi:hypothetical protein [Paraglaciecola sp. L3A3]|uniref:hypothetical protein n=1 Tax=Paraglaciecola sp. L3A3 TaxID=2686358 RepID=UPI001E5CA9B8|nr:hypothetical protein [Paraglaciecola sp. L3A3]